MTYSCQEEGFSLITLAMVSFPWTGRVCQGKQLNKERMNGRMKEREGWSLGRSDWQAAEERAGTRSWKLLFDNVETATRCPITAADRKTNVRKRRKRKGAAVRRLTMMLNQRGENTRDNVCSHENGGGDPRAEASFMTLSRNVCTPVSTPNQR